MTNLLIKAIYEPRNFVYALIKHRYWKSIFNIFPASLHTNDKSFGESHHNGHPRELRELAIFKNLSQSHHTLPGSPTTGRYLKNPVNKHLFLSKHSLHGSHRSVHSMRTSGSTHLTTSKRSLHGSCRSIRAEECEVLMADPTYM